jgi:hypothetical protein
MEQNPIDTDHDLPRRTGRSLVRNGPNVFFDELPRFEPTRSHQETPEETTTEEL